MHRSTDSRFAAAGLALALLACGACGEASEDAAPAGAAAAERATPVTVARPERERFVDTIEALGTAGANESVVITAQVTETVSRVRFDDGDVVAAGDVLVELTSREESAQLDQARASYAEAERQFERTRELRREGTASQATLDERTAARDAARARLEELQARMRDRLVRAPFAGVLGLRAVSPGTLVQPGDPITTLDDIDTIKLDFSVPERFLSVLAPGLPVRARAAAYPERTFEGRVRAIDTRIDPTTRAVRVRADLPNPDRALRPGMLLTVELEAHPRDRIALPEQAIVPVGEEQYVFVLDGDSRVRRVALETGRRRAGRVEVLDGLDGGETIVVEGGSMLRPGGLVRVVERDEAAVLDAPPPTRAGG
ncbi:MAG: efflux RND transporter periplasmic adaptor subunit [Myxococcota bacterium]